MVKILMGNKNIYRDSHAEAHLPASGNLRSDTEKRSGGADGLNFHYSNRLHNRKMGETIAIKLINLFGWSVTLLGIVPEKYLQFNDIVSMLIRILAAAFIVYKLLMAHESWRMKVIDRKEREDAYRKNKLK